MVQASRTNEILKRNAAMLRTGTAEAQREVERGVVDIETVRKVNQELIATIQESLQIAEEGRRKRVEAQAEMVRLENDLRQTLVQARADRGRLAGGGEGRLS